MEPTQSARVQSASAAVDSAMKSLRIQAGLNLHREDGNLVFWVGNDLVAKASTGNARTELAHEALVLNALRPYGLPVAEMPEGHTQPVAAGDWTVLFTRRLQAKREQIDLPDLLVSLRELHAGLQSALSNVDLPDWSAILEGAESCRQANAFTGAEAALMQRAYEAVVRPAIEMPHAGHVIHGDVDFNQAIATDEGLVWIDFETACRGPLEWDLAAFDDVSAYGDCDRDLWLKLRLVHSWCVASWCNRSDVENPSRRAARQLHLEILATAFA